MRGFVSFILIAVFLIMPCLSYAQGEVEAYVEPYVDYVEPYTRDMYPGNTGDDVVFMQHRLYGLGYLSDVGNGEYTSDTEQAVMMFQSSHAHLGLSATGIADKATLNVLTSDAALEASLKNGDRGDGVKKLQQALAEYGFLHSEADGIFGNDTFEAVKALQENLIKQGIAGYGNDGSASALLLGFLYGGQYNPYVRDLTLSCEGEDVKSVSGRLNSLGYTDVTTDVFDVYLKDAIADFQKNSALDVTGEADKPTFAELFSENAAKAKRYTCRELKYGDSGDTVTQLQWALMTIGFMSGYTTGTFDARTLNALESLTQYWPDFGGFSSDAISAKAQDIIIDGEIPSYTYDIKSGDKGDAVKRVQRRLSTLFYVTQSSADGVAGSEFESAIKSFQEKNGLAVTGIADETTQKALFSYTAISNGTPYILSVSTNNQRVYVYRRLDDGMYELYKTMLCSTGMDKTPTPNGVYSAYTRKQHRWHFFKEFDCWAQYTFIISGNILFHSVLYNSRSENSTRYTSVNNLGRKASHGCVRLAVDDAKWIYDNCEAKTIVVVHPM